MNEIKLSGMLTEVVEHDSPTGKVTTAVLEFSEDGQIALVTVGQQLARFDSGDSVCIIGRIVSHNGGHAVMLDHATAWSARRQAHDTKPELPTRLSPRASQAARELREVRRTDRRRGMQRGK